MTEHVAEKKMSDREEIELLLPWYATGKLSSEDQQRVADYLAENPDVARQMDLIAEEAEASITANEALGAPSAGALDRLMARLDAQASPESAFPAQGFLARLRAFLPEFGSPALQLAGVAAAVIICVQAAVITGLVTSENAGNNYVTATGGDASDGPLFLISFVDKATAKQIAGLLAEFDAVIVDGPKAGGIYQIRVAPAEDGEIDQEALLNKLRARKAIVRSLAKAE